MEDSASYLDCPAYLGNDLRCGLPAEIEMRYAIRSSDGPLEAARVRCLRGHWFNGSIESLTVARPADPRDHNVLEEAGRLLRP